MDFRTGASDTAPTIYASGTQLRFAEGGTDRITGGSLALNTWQHVVVARNAGTTRLFLDGVVVGTYTDNNDYGAIGLLSLVLIQQCQQLCWSL